MTEKRFKINYRNIGPKDLDKLVRFCDRWIGKGYFKKDELRDALLRGIKDDINASFLAEIEGKIIGIRICYAPDEWVNIKNMDFLSPGAWGVEITEVAYFKSLFIHGKYQKKGIGSKLSRLAINSLKEMGAKAIVAHAWKESPENSSLKYLNKMGFKEVSEHKRFWYLHEYDCTRCGEGQKCECSACEMVLTL